MIDFRECYNQLTGNGPFDWQEKLFEKFLNGEFPEACDIPTGLGKTNVIAIWLIALGFQLKDKNRKIPLRLVYVVDRRVIVDQAMVEAEKFLKKLKDAINDPASSLYEFAKVFQESSFTGKDEVIALSTLRGQKADNRKWCLDPADGFRFVRQGIEGHNSFFLGRTDQTDVFEFVEQCFERQTSVVPRRHDPTDVF